MSRVSTDLIRTSGLPPCQKQQVYRKFRNNQVIKLAKGIYIDSGLWRELGQDRDALRLRTLARLAAVSQSQPKHLLVGHSAAFLHRLPVESFVPPTCAELGAVQRGSYPTNSHLSWRRIPVSHQKNALVINTEFGQVRTTGIAYTCLDLALWHSLDDALIATEHALHTSQLSRATWLNTQDRFQCRVGSAQARQIFRLATPWSESPRESQVKLCMWEAGLPAPLQQATVFDVDGYVIGRPDFLYPLGLAIEYDGKAKYGTDLDQVLRSLRTERIRENSLQAGGLFFVRITSANYHDRSAFVAIQQLRNTLELHRWDARGLRYKAAGPAWN